MCILNRSSFFSAGSASGRAGHRQDRHVESLHRQTERRDTRQQEPQFLLRHVTAAFPGNVPECF